MEAKGTTHDGPAPRSYRICLERFPHFLLRLTWETPPHCSAPCCVTFIASRQNAVRIFSVRNHIWRQQNIFNRENKWKIYIYIHKERGILTNKNPAIFFFCIHTCGLNAFRVGCKHNHCYARMTKSRYSYYSEGIDCFLIVDLCKRSVK